MRASASFHYAVLDRFDFLLEFHGLLYSAFKKALQ